MEIWKDIPEYENYQVSNEGRVRSLNYLGWGKIKIMGGFNTRGYHYVSLFKEGKIKSFSIHRLVYQAFNGELIKGLVIDHISGDKSDNRPENLQQITYRANTTKGKSCLNKSSEYVGVSWNTRRNKWRVSIRINGKTKNLGLYKTELEAHEVYQNKLKEIQSK